MTPAQARDTWRRRLTHTAASGLNAAGLTFGTSGKSHPHNRVYRGPAQPHRPAVGRVTGPGSKHPDWSEAPRLPPGVRAFPAMPAAIVKGTPDPNRCAASDEVPVAVPYCCTRPLNPGLRISNYASYLGGAKRARTADLLHAISRQDVHRSLSVQVTVHPCPYQATAVRASCCTFLLYCAVPADQACHTPWQTPD